MKDINLEQIAKKLTKKKLSLKQMKIGIKELRELKERGYNIKSELYNKTNYYWIKIMDNDNHLIISPRKAGTTIIKYVEISDLHAGSSFFDDKGLEWCLKEAKDRGFKHIHNSGDTVDGNNVYRGHVNYLKYVREDDQVKCLVDIIGKYQNDFDWIAIDGNHDMSWINKGAPSPNKLISKEIKNYTYLPGAGADKVVRGDLIIDGVMKRLVHPWSNSGRGTYAKCFDDKTEVFTNKGFKLFKDLKKNDFIGTLNKDTQILEWQKPTSIVNEFFDGELIHFKARTLDIMVTPNHRMMVRRSKSHLWKLNSKLMPQKSHISVNRNWQEKTAKWLFDNHVRQKWTFKKDFNWKGNELPKGVNIDKLILLGWYLTEGSLYNPKTGQKRLIISQSKAVNPENWKEVQDIFYRLFGVFNGGKNGITIANNNICNWLSKNCGVGSYHKYMPQWIKELSPIYLKLLIKTMVKGDGWKIGKSFGYKSYSKRLLDDFFEICLKAGYVPTINYKAMTVTVATIQKEPSINSKPRKVKYKGRIYCANVPNETLLVRRNGKIVWTYNSYPGQVYLRNVMDHNVEFEIGGKKYHLKLLQYGHLHYDMMYESFGVIVTHPMSFQKPNDFTEGKGLVGPRGLRLTELKINDGELLQYKSEALKVPENL